MKFKKEFVLRKVCGMDVVTATGTDNINFSKIISLNGTAAYLWTAVQGIDFDDAKLVDLLMSKYDVDRATAEADVVKFVRTVKEAGLTEE